MLHTPEHPPASQQQAWHRGSSNNAGKGGIKGSHICQNTCKCSPQHPLLQVDHGPAFQRDSSLRDRFLIQQIPGGRIIGEGNHQQCILTNKPCLWCWQHVCTLPCSLTGPAAAYLFARGAYRTASSDCIRHHNHLTMLSNVI